jgi:hypothetical protein
MLEETANVKTIYSRRRDILNLLRIFILHEKRKTYSILNEAVGLQFFTPFLTSP